MDWKSLCSVRLSEDGSGLVILDQTRLPNETVFLTLTTQEEIREAIYRLRVRGAPAIGIAAAYGAYLGMRASRAEDYGAFCAEFRQVKAFLASARPTAVNLFWALDRMERRLEGCAGLSADGLKGALRAEAEAIRAEDEEICRSIGEHALPLLKGARNLMTHCNAGTLATARYGTALAPVYLGLERGIHFHVFADETRPLLQGARLTAWELREAGVDVTLVCDGMCASVMKNGWADAVLVGCDRVAANGDAANKIGTSTLAIVAKEYAVPFYVCAPCSTFDLNCKSGADIEIELRKPEEVTHAWYETPMAPAGVEVYNPAFDVTDSRYITAIITEKGPVFPPFPQGIAALFGAG